jgi:hypothetical protein
VAEAKVYLSIDVYYTKKYFIQRCTLAIDQQLVAAGKAGHETNFDFLLMNDQN